jgi:gliding motility-associated-like protein
VQLLSVYNTPAISAGGRDACIGDAIDFSATNLTPAIAIAGWHWSLGDGNKVTLQNISYTYKTGGSYTAEVYAESSDGCLSDSFRIPVKIVDISLDAGRDTLIAKGQPLQLNAVAAGDDLSYSWYPATGLNDALIADPVAVLFQNVKYVLTVTSPEGCVQVDSLFVKAYTGPEFYVPSAFSPNHDGQNDLFRAIAAGVPQLDFLCVWDRWGKEIFRTSSLTSAWDGTFKGQDSPVGTYVYQIQGTDYTGHKFSRKGTVTLVR